MSAGTCQGPNTQLLAAWCWLDRTCQLPETIVGFCFSLQGFQSHWYSNRVLPVYDGSHRPANPTLLLKQVPQQPGLHLWLVKPPNSRCASSRAIL